MTWLMAVTVIGIKFSTILQAVIVCYYHVAAYHLSEIGNLQHSSHKVQIYSVFIIYCVPQTEILLMDPLE